MVTSLCFTDISTPAAHRKASSSKRKYNAGGMDVDYDETDQVAGRSQLLTAGVDKTVKLWSTSADEGEASTPLQTYMGKNGFKCAPTC
jgi:hypothetical protein